MKSSFFILLLMMAVKSVYSATPAQELMQRQAADEKSVQIYHDSVAHLIDYVHSRSDLFPASQPQTTHLLTENERNAVHSLWSSLLDYYLLLDSIRRFHTDDYVLPITSAQVRSFHIARSAFLTQYRYALEFIDRIEHDDKLAVLLNDPVPELGLAANSYNKFKFRFLNVAIASEFAAYSLIANTIPNAANSALAQTSAADEAYIWQAGKGKGEILTLANAGNVLKSTGLQLVFPIQAGVSEWMGDTKILRQDKSLISSTQINTLQSQLEPGDVMLERREWYVSNVGLPGFWSHAALYIGTPEQRRAYFNSEEVRQWVIEQGEASGDFDALLRKDSASIYDTSLKPQEHNHQTRVLEAISEGVSFTSIEHSASADSIAVLRPRLSRVEKAQALRRAFKYSGRPYDFNFDFQTDSSLVCTELVYKAYEPANNFRGIRLSLQEMAGRTVIPANAIAQQFDHEFGLPAQQFDLVAFLDGQEKRGIAVTESVDTFRKSWKRPKWHVFL